MLCLIDRASHTSPLMILLGAQGDRIKQQWGQSPEITVVAPQSLLDPAATRIEIRRTIWSGLVGPPLDPFYNQQVLLRAYSLPDPKRDCTCIFRTFYSSVKAIVPLKTWPSDFF